jgi:hypothetical protein
MQGLGYARPEFMARSVAKGGNTRKTSVGGPSLASGMLGEGRNLMFS